MSQPGVLLAACVGLAVLLLLAFVRVRALNGVQVFTLDDAYISAGIARHIVLDHVWGVSPHSFSSASSSILWPLLIAGGFLVFGVHMSVPFGLNVLFALLLAAAMGRVLQKEVPRAPAWWMVLVVLLVALVMPLPMMVFVGMEHVGFALASLLLMVEAGNALARTHEAGAFSGRELLRLAALAAFACSLRYEGMFQCAVIGGLFLLRRQWRAVAAVGLGGALPIVSFGLYAMHHGAHFFPNSLLQKTGTPTRLLHSIVLFIPNKGLLSHFSLTNGVFAVFAATVLVLGMEMSAVRSGRGGLSLSLRYAMAVFVATLLLHCQFSQLNWLWRYESYLMCAGTLFLLVAATQIILRGGFADARRMGLVTAGAAACAVVAMVPRAWNSFADIPNSAYAIYEQQYQTGMFLMRFYRGQAVVLNDIGVPGYKADAQILDLAGLGSLEVTDLQIAHHFDTAAMARLAAEHHSRVAILYRKWFHGAVEPPAGWTEVGSWTVRPMDSRVPVADRTFTFFAVRPEEVGYLHESLCNNRAFVPVDEVQQIAAPCAVETPQP